MSSLENLPAVMLDIAADKAPANDAMNPLELARAKRAEMRAAGQQVERLDPIERARRNPTSKALAIKAKCFECVGAGSDANPRGAVRDCSITMCPLHPVRPWQAKQGSDDNDADEGSDDE